ncbi:MAG: recombinase family protein, partial [Rhodospirillales bacterium]|nr:recombinase family protein [Rhodospirillales bacterium]
MKRGRRADDRSVQFIPYFRKSSEDKKEKQILSLKRQRRWARQRAEAEGHTLQTHLEEEKSAKLPYMRPVFDDLLARIKRGEAQGIYVWKLDRLARNPEEAGIIMGMLARGEILLIITSQRTYRPEDNALISYVDFGIADQYSRDLSSNVYDGLHHKAAMGDYPSHACLGYLNTRYREKGKNRIVHDPERFDKTRQVLQRLLTGNYSVAEVIFFAENTLHLTAPPWGSRPARTMSRSGWYRFFANPLPSGWYEYPKGSGNWIKGN